MRELFGVIKNEKSGKNLKEYVERNKNRFSNLDEETYNAIKVFINLDKYTIKEADIRNERDGVNVSQALEDIKMEGKIEDAEKMLGLKMEIDVISEITGLTKKEILKIKESNKKTSRG